VTRAHVAALHHKMRDKPTQANRTIEIISKMFNLAEEWGLRPANSNPRRGLKKYPETKRERFLSEAELQRIGEVLAEMEAERVEMPSAIAAARLLMFTGCRLGEIMTLQWRFVDLRAGVLRLPRLQDGARRWCSLGSRR
jgi:integrase